MGLLLGLLGLFMMAGAMNNQPEQPPLVMPPAIPSEEQTDEDARKEMMRRMNSRRDQTLLTGPGGLEDEEADIKRNTLLTQKEEELAPQGEPATTLG